MKSFDRFVRDHQADPKGQRMGQKFCALYVNSPWPELFYASDADAPKMIQQWLVDHQYIDELPTREQK